MIKYKDLLGKQFQMGARGPDTYDCWGLCLEVGRRASINFPEEFTPELVEDRNNLIIDIRKSYFREVNSPSAFCIVLFSFKRPFIDHCGIVLENKTHFLHTINNHNVSVNRLDHKIFVKKIVGFYEYENNNKH